LAIHHASDVAATIGHRKGVIGRAKRLGTKGFGHLVLAGDQVVPVKMAMVFADRVDLPMTGRQARDA
jgi:hypothetical protein